MPKPKCHTLHEIVFFDGKKEELFQEFAQHPDHYIALIRGTIVNEDMVVAMSTKGADAVVCKIKELAAERKARLESDE